MKLTVSAGPLTDVAGDVLVVERYAGEPRLTPEAVRVDRALNGLLARALAEERFEGRLGETTHLHAAGRLAVKRLVVVGMGPRGECTPESIRRAASAALRRARDLGARTVATGVLGTRAPARVRAQALGEGALLGLYTFDRYKAKKDESRAVESLTVAVAERGERAAVRDGLRLAELTAEAASFARDLINEPANSVTPTALAHHAETIAKAGGLRVRVYDRAACERLGMGAFLGVNRGSQEPPRFIHLAYAPRRAGRRVALVGKGITFDSGGLDLKTAEGMAWMKGDMSGAAAVLGVMKVLPRLRPAVEVHGLIAATDNMPSGSATKPGDILRTMSGKTIEVNNTDAEGRLTLADAIAYALREVKPDELVDIATLTGACSIALGALCGGALANDPGLQRRVLRAAEEAGERLWPLPLIEEYREGLKSDVADLRNTGPRPGGAITAALFLKEFAGATPWVHLDIAGAAFTEKELPYAAKGGVGFGTRTLIAYVMAAGGRGMRRR
ncbi:MAG TPA: leucyl aminopeptidase [Methylomirabilota bacterium]|jgi:leucyl aminopeptidase|nr:leucyl aminopeptidase [Methylomirabilota bacterium]